MNDQIKSPYNFVPLADFVYEPEWADRVSQDIPFSDGLSGVLECELTARTPLHVGCGDEDGRPVRHGNEYIIPGSSLKGMIRNVLGIAAFGRFDRIDDYRMSIRDLTQSGREAYGSRMVQDDAATGETVPRVKAGWLHLIDGVWHLESCKYLRIEHSDLNKLNQGWLSERDRKGCRSSDKYAKWSRDVERFRVTVDDTIETRRKGPKTLRFDKAVPNPQGAIEGWMVFTGQPGPNKHMEFVFHSESGTPRPVPEGIWRDFQRIHNDTDEWKFLTSESPYWQAWRTVPVFYLSTRTEHGEALEAIGLSQMFRLPYRYSIGDLCPDGLKSAGDDESRPLDLPDLLFGDAFDKTPRVRGRVQFGLARPTSEARLGPPQDLVLNNPKPSFYPAYLRQDGGRARTYSDKEAVLAGWKRYPAADGLREHPGTIDNDRIVSRVRFLEAGTIFRFRLRFHNLRPAELGALYWSLTLGDDGRLRHRLGKGKPYGYGEVGVAVLAEGSSIRNVRGSRQDAGKTLEYAMAEFEATMDKACKGKRWRQTEQVRALLAMSDPARSRAADLTYYATPKEYQTLKNATGGALPRLKRYD